MIRKVNITSNRKTIRNKITVVVPSLREANNLEILIPLISETLARINHEIIIVDDNSNDGTIELVAGFNNKYPVNIRVRKKEKGLSSAIIHGINCSDGEFVAVMDADFSHPPENLKEMFKEIKKGYDLIIGSRAIENGNKRSMGYLRGLISYLATLLVYPLTTVKDPMSGYFMIRKDKIIGLRIRPLGYKALLEILTRKPNLRFKEIPIHFNNRLYGKSKLKLGIISAYIQQLILIYKDKFLHS